MRITFRSLRSGWRLAMGGLRLPAASRRGRADSDWELISVDVFETLVARTADDDTAWHEGTLHAAEVARSHGLLTRTDPIALRRRVERRLSADQFATGKDPEFPHRQVLEEMLREWGADEQASAWAVELGAWELAREIEWTRPLEDVGNQVRAWLKAGRRIVALSDTRYSSEELATLLSRHGISGLSAIYSSADEGASKFSGRLFDLVAQREGVRPSRILHIGDNPLGDTLAPSQRGLAVRRIRRSPAPPQLPPAPAEANEQRDPAFAVGYRTLGPILVAFARLLVDRARRDGITRLAFVARDGDLPLQVAQTLLQNQEGSHLMLQYLHLSRRSLACASSDLQCLHTDPSAVERVLATLRGIRGMGTMLESFQNLYNVPADLIARHAARLRAEAGREPDLRRLLSDELAAADLAKAFQAMRERVRRYLLQEGIASQDCALVDIGWRGSLQKILQSESRSWGLAAPHGYYLGLWNEDGRGFPEVCTGLITDQRRGRGLLEGAAWHVAFLLEAVCRADHGMVTGYTERAAGRIEPIHIETGEARAAEIESAQVQTRVREGVLAYARWFAESHSITVSTESALRRAAQRTLRKLAFFPSPAESELGRLLVYSEPTSEGEALKLIANSGSNLPEWISGLRSPWKGGYLHANWGALASGVYCVLEATVSHLPRGTKAAIRRLLIHE